MVEYNLAVYYLTRAVQKTIVLQLVNWNKYACKLDWYTKQDWYASNTWHQATKDALP